jgi:hypothetical protein
VKETDVDNGDPWDVVEGLLNDSEPKEEVAVELVPSSINIYLNIF